MNEIDLDDLDDLDLLLNLDNITINNSNNCNSITQNEIDLEINEIFNEIEKEQNEIKLKLLNSKEKLKNLTENSLLYNNNINNKREEKKQEKEEKEEKKNEIEIKQQQKEEETEERHNNKNNKNNNNNNNNNSLKSTPPSQKKNSSKKKKNEKDLSVKSSPPVKAEKSNKLEDSVIETSSIVSVTDVNNTPIKESISEKESQIESMKESKLSTQPTPLINFEKETIHEKIENISTSSITTSSSSTTTSIIPSTKTTTPNKKNDIKINEKKIKQEEKKMTSVVEIKKETKSSHSIILFITFFLIILGVLLFQLKNGNLNNLLNQSFQIRNENNIVSDEIVVDSNSLIITENLNQDNVVNMNENIERDIELKEANELTSELQVVHEIIEENKIELNIDDPLNNNTNIHQDLVINEINVESIDLLDNLQEFDSKVNQEDQVENNIEKEEKLQHSNQTLFVDKISPENDLEIIHEIEMNETIEFENNVEIIENEEQANDDHISSTLVKETNEISELLETELESYDKITNSIEQNEVELQFDESTNTNEENIIELKIEEKNEKKDILFENDESVDSKQILMNTNENSTINESIPQTKEIENENINLKSEKNESIFENYIYILFLFPVLGVLIIFLFCLLKPKHKSQSTSINTSSTINNNDTITTSSSLLLSTTTTTRRNQSISDSPIIDFNNVNNSDNNDIRNEGIDEVVFKEESELDIGVTADGSRGGFRMKRGDGINFEKQYQKKYLTPKPQNYGQIPLPVLSSNRKDNHEDIKRNPLPAMTVKEALSFSLAAKQSTLQE